MKLLSTLLNVALLIGAASGLGEIKATCPLVNRLTDDPLVFPKQPGASHMHDFFGASRVDAFTTPAQMRNSATSCNPSLDHSAYWIPSLIKNGKYVEQSDVTIYYHAFAYFDKVQTMPLGLTMISTQYKWGCVGTPGNFDVSSFPIPDCGNRPLNVLISFPQCWNGKDISSPDHKSHMTYAKANKCPSNFPILLPRLQFKIQYPVGSGGPGASLSSGSGTTAHGDFVNGWDPNGLMLRINQCLRKNTKCKETLPGDASISPAFPNTVLPVIYFNETAAPVDPNDHTDPVNEADTIKAHSDSFVIIPDADSYVEENDNLSNFGDNDFLVIASGNQTGTQETYLNFDMSSAPADMSSCFLELFVDEEFSTMFSFEMNLGIVNEEWKETEINYQNKPASEFKKKITRGANEESLKVDITDLCKSAQTSQSKVLSFHLYADGPSTEPFVLNSREAGFNRSPKIVITNSVAFLKPAFLSILLFVVFLIL